MPNLSRYNLIILLPYPSFEKSAETLDYIRLKVQAATINQLLTNLKCGSPCAKMWVNNPKALKVYYNALVTERCKRRYTKHMVLWDVVQFDMPWWFGNKVVHASHRSFLLFQSYQYYKKYEWSEIGSDNLYYPC